MTTFSQLVDAMILETRRPDLVTDIQSYVNQTLREMHFEPERNGAILYRDNMLELSLAADLETGFTWELPNPQRFQAMQAVRYDNVLDELGRPMYVNERIPGRVMRGLNEYYYRAAGYYAFFGYGGVDSTINLAYYEFTPAHKYKLLADREASYDVESGWSYSAAADIDDDTRLAARILCSNWILLRWSDVVAEGVKAKVYKRVGDESRGRTSYSLYAQLRRGLYTSEAVTPDGSY